MPFEVCKRRVHEEKKKNNKIKPTTHKNVLLSLHSVLNSAGCGGFTVAVAEPDWLTD